jgi:cytoskeleton protein RodZ
MNPEDPNSVTLKMESPPAPLDELTALSALRAIRVARGLSIEDVAARLKFGPKVIDAFESERWDELPKGLALRTLAKNYTRFLGVDLQAIEPILSQRMDQTPTSISNHTSTRSIGQRMESDVSTGSWGWVVLVLIAVALVVGIAYWQDMIPSQVLPSWMRS